MPGQVMGLWRNESHPLPPSLPPLPHPHPHPHPPCLFGCPGHPACSFGVGMCWLELNAIHSPWFLDKLFPQTSILLCVAQNYFQLLSNSQAALAHDIVSMVFGVHPQPGILWDLSKAFTFQFPNRDQSEHLIQGQLTCRLDHWTNQIPSQKCQWKNKNSTQVLNPSSVHLGLRWQFSNTFMLVSRQS